MPRVNQQALPICVQNVGPGGRADGQPAAGRVRPERADQIAHRQDRGSRGGRPSRFDPALYAGRDVVERFFNRLKQFRGLITRYAKRGPLPN